MGSGNGAVSEIMQPYSMGEAQGQSYAPIHEDTGRRVAVTPGYQYPSDGVFMPKATLKPQNVEKGKRAPAVGTFVPRTISNVKKAPWIPQKPESENNVLDHKRTRDHRTETHKIRAVWGPPVAPMGIQGVEDPLERTHWRCYNHKQIKGHRYLRPWSPQVEMQGLKRYTTPSDCSNFGMKTQDECFKACDRIPQCAWVQWAPMLWGPKRDGCKKVGQCLLISRESKNGVLGVHFEAAMPVALETSKVQQLCIRPKQNSKEAGCHETCPVKCGKDYYRMVEIMQERAKKNAAILKGRAGKEKRKKQEIKDKIYKKPGPNYLTIRQENATIQVERRRLEMKETLEKHQLRQRDLSSLQQIQDTWKAVKDVQFKNETIANEKGEKVVAKDEELRAFEKQTQAEAMTELKRTEGWQTRLSTRASMAGLVQQDLLTANQTLNLSRVEAGANETKPGYEPNAAELKSKAALQKLMNKVPNRKPTPTDVFGPGAHRPKRYNHGLQVKPSRVDASSQGEEGLEELTDWD